MVPYKQQYIYIYIYITNVEKVVFEVVQKVIKHTCLEVIINLDTVVFLYCSYQHYLVQYWLKLWKKEAKWKYQSTNTRLELEWK
jgi:hypothetical protein